MSCFLLLHPLGMYGSVATCYHYASQFDCRHLYITSPPSGAGVDPGTWKGNSSRGESPKKLVIYRVYCIDVPLPTPKKTNQSFVDIENCKLTGGERERERGGGSSQPGESPCISQCPFMLHLQSWFASSCPVRVKATIVAM